MCDSHYNCISRWTLWGCQCGLRCCELCCHLYDVVCMLTLVVMVYVYPTRALVMNLSRSSVLVSPLKNPYWPSCSILMDFWCPLYIWEVWYFMLINHCPIVLTFLYGKSGRYSFRSYQWWQGIHISRPWWHFELNDAICTYCMVSGLILCLCIVCADQWWA